MKPGQASVLVAIAWLDENDEHLEALRQMMLEARTIADAAELDYLDYKRVVELARQLQASKPLNPSPNQRWQLQNRPGPKRQNRLRSHSNMIGAPSIGIQLLPDDGDPAGRPVVVGVRDYANAPILKLMRRKDMGVSPTVITDLPIELQEQLPARQKLALMST